MENPIIVLAAVAVAFGVINIVLWLFLIKNDKKPLSAGIAKGNDVQNVVFASEKRMIDTITKMMSALKNSSAPPSPVDSKKIAAEVTEGLKNQSREVNLPELAELKKSADALAGKTDVLSGKIDSVEKGMKNISGEILKQKDFIEALDGHIVTMERPKA
ncbi:hypothetical protein KJ633_06865 [bacterium]|nr:hypothetical protein [bacterium]MBU3956167.1 hypothetical protein [bacterium]MBU4133930.1 hypothetical protein [bacterium]